MKELHNDRGAALVYVLMLLMVLGLVSPVLLNIVSSQTLATNQTSYEKKATQYLYGAMDAFIAYVEADSIDVDWRTYFSEYAGWSSKLSPAIVSKEDGQRYHIVSLPDRDTLLYSFTYAEPPKIGENEVTMTVIAGDRNQNGQKDEEEPFFVKKQLTYNVKIEQDSGFAMPIGSLEGGSDNIKVVDDIDDKINRVKPKTFDYEVDSIDALIKKMNEAKDREDGQYTFKLSLKKPLAHTSQPWLNIDFSEAVIGEGKTYIVYVTQVDQNGQDIPIAHNQPALLSFRFVDWKMRGMLIINGDAHVGNQVKMEINNVLVNGLFKIQGGGRGNTSYRGFFEAQSKDIKGNPLRSGRQSSGQYYTIEGDPSQTHWSIQRK